MFSAYCPQHIPLRCNLLPQRMMDIPHLGRLISLQAFPAGDRQVLSRLKEMPD